MARVHIGDELDVVLGSTYWQITTPSSPVIAAIGEPVRAGGTTCAPGVGCGTMSARYRVVASGSTTLSADRTICGEALRCVPPQAFRVTVVAGP